jgi:hypothetical protein
MFTVGERLGGLIIISAALLSLDDTLEKERLTQL